MCWSWAHSNSLWRHPPKPPCWTNPQDQPPSPPPSAQSDPFPSELESTASNSPGWWHHLPRCPLLQCHWMLFLLLFLVHFQPNFIHFPYFTFLLHVYPSYVFPFYASFTLMNRQQEHHSIVQLVTDNSIYLATDILKQSCSPFPTWSCARTLSATLTCSHHSVEQAVVYSTLPQEYSTLTFRGEVVAGGGGVEERSKVIYWHRMNTVIYYMLGFYLPGSYTCHPNSRDQLHYRWYPLVMLHTAFAGLKDIVRLSGCHRDIYKWPAFFIVPWTSNVEGRIKDGSTHYQFSPTKGLPKS